MDVFLKVAIQLPIFSPLIYHNPTPERSSTELHFSRWNNANAEQFNQRRRTIHEIEDEICRTRRYTVADNIITLPPPPPFPPLPKLSNLLEPPRLQRLEFRPGPENVKIGEDGVSYVVDGAPFDFKFSYTETPKANLVKLREPPYVPFGPPTLPRPWTGRNPVPPSKTKVTNFHLLSPPLSDGEGAELVRLAVPIWESREQVLGEPLTENENNRLVKRAGKSSRQLHIGRDGVCSIDMDNVCQQLEERTGGKIIHRHFGTEYLFRGRNYNYETRPRFPLMRWRPVSPVYPKLIKRVPEGLTLAEAIEMRQKGRVLMPICKLAKNGVYSDLVTNVREAFEQCDLDLVPCLLLSFEDDHILMCRGQNWRTSLPNLRDDDEEATKINIDSGNSNKLPSDSQKLSAASLHKNTTEHLCNEPLDISILSHLDDLSLHEVDPCLLKNSNLPMSVVSDAASLPMKTCELEITEDVTAIFCTPEMVPGTYKNFASTVADPYSDKLLDGSEAANVSESSRCAPCTEGVLLLLDQAVEKGHALVLDDKFLDDDYIYQTTMAFAKSTPSEPFYKLNYQTGYDCDKQDLT
ncbi:hypothetical protein VNO80_06489 [Phaseolus coccineus]|uniref:Uncharacterized protein n=1 Tax=Phaseolus coccineus TaxID=3886 RepID=A0AAN9NHU0_PHACN